jgi:hypothetical protein
MKNKNNIISGRLYNWKGITVRAFGLGPVGKYRLVVAHKILSGLVEDTDLKPITKQEVDAYLNHA